VNLTLMEMSLKQKQIVFDVLKNPNAMRLQEIINWIIETTGIVEAHKQDSYVFAAYFQGGPLDGATRLIVANLANIIAPIRNERGAIEEAVYELAWGYDNIGILYYIFVGYQGGLNEQEESGGEG